MMVPLATVVGRPRLVALRAISASALVAGEAVDGVDFEDAAVDDGLPGVGVVAEQRDDSAAGVAAGDTRVAVDRAGDHDVAVALEDELVAAAVVLVDLAGECERAGVAGDAGDPADGDGGDFAGPDVVSGNVAQDAAGALPWPVSVTRWPERVMSPWSSSDAPLATVTEDEPSASEWRRLSTPALTVVGPVFEFAPERTRVPAPVLVMPPLPLIVPLTVVVLDGMLKVVAASSVRMPPRVWATLAVLVTAGALPARKSASPVRFTAPLVRLSLLASSRPRLLVEEMEPVLLKTMVVSKAEIGCWGDQVAVLQLPALAVVKVVGVTAGTTLTWVEFALSMLPLRAVTT